MTHRVQTWVEVNTASEEPVGDRNLTRGCDSRQSFDGIS